MTRTSVHHEPTATVANDCGKLIFLRRGSAIVFSEFGQRPVSSGDAVILVGADSAQTRLVVAVLAAARQRTVAALIEGLHPCGASGG